MACFLFTLTALIALAMPTGWADAPPTHTQGARPPSGESESPLGTPATPPSGGDDAYSVLLTDAEQPVTFSPCRAVHYVLRSEGAPPRGKALLTSAIEEASAATGLRFVDDGFTDEEPRAGRRTYQPERYGDRWAPVLIAWGDAADSMPELGVESVSGGSPTAVHTEGGDTAYVTGTVLLDPARIEATQRQQGDLAARAMVLHALGHLVGLGHTDHEDQIMSATIAPGVTAFGPGDLTGLARAGSGPCQPTL